MALHLVHQQDVFLQRALASGGVEGRQRRSSSSSRPSAHAVLAAHQGVLLLQAARQDGAGCGCGGDAGGHGGSSGNIGEAQGQHRGLGDQAAATQVHRVAVRVPVLLLDVPAKLPALPLLKDLRLHLEGNVLLLKSEKCFPDAHKTLRAKVQQTELKETLV